MTNPMPPGWYDNPDGTPNSERFWDGLGWTPESRMKAMPSPMPTPPPMYPPAPDPYAPPAYPPPGFSQLPFPPPPYPMWQQPRPQASNLFSIIAFVCAGISVLLLPVVFGPAGLILGAVGLSKKERLAPIAMAASVVCMIAGMVIGVLVMRALH